MRLLERTPDGEFKISTFDDDHPPPYAILSHTWSDGQEVTYEGFITGAGKSLPGYAKLRFCAERAAADGLDYFWIDTCCINKNDDHELKTALNSMFRWYQRAVKCYVYLSDVRVPDEAPDPQEYRITWESSFRRSRWFTRGWTLQELLAPAIVEFFSANDKKLGCKITLEKEIHEITRIPVSALRKYDLNEFTVDERMSWAATRNTSVKEDRAYCLLGIFGVFLAPIPGEGEEYALGRLRAEIRRVAELALPGSDVADMQKISASKSLPFSQNEFFTGRESHLQTLQEQLGPSSAHRRMSLFGLGGCGKTALVLELAYRMMTTYPGFLVLWVPALNRESFDTAYREIGILLGLPGISDPNADIKQLVKNGLDSGEFKDWLMIVDNADDPDLLLKGASDTPQSKRLYDYLPRSDRGSILFTTRGRKVAESLTPGSVLELESMSMVEAQQLIERRIPNKSLLDNASAISKLLELLTCLPLAIVQASAFINSNQTSISDYVSLFEEADTEVEVFNERFEDPTRYHETENTIAKTWQISFDRIRKQDPVAAGYLSFMACIDRLSIPQSLLPSNGSKVQHAKALGTLIGYAFITERQRDPELPEDERLFDVHRLVQMATAWWLKEHGDWPDWTQKAYCRLQELLPLKGGYVERQKWVHYLPHAIHICRFYDKLSVLGEWSLFDQIGQCQIWLGQYTTAEATLRQLLPLRRDILGDEHERTIDNMDLLGNALFCLDKNEEAEMISRQVLALSKKVHGKRHPKTLVTRSQVASVLADRGKYKEAGKMYTRTLALQEAVLGKGHPDTIVNVIGIADILKSEGKHEEAETQYRRALTVSEQVHGKEDPDTLWIMDGLATAISEQGRYEEAEALYKQLLPLKEKVHGKEHPDTLSTMHNLATAISGQGRHKEAETILRQVLALFGKVLGKRHWPTFSTAHHLAWVLAAQDLYDEAASLYKMTGHGLSEVLGADHKKTRKCWDDYQEMLARKGSATLGSVREDGSSDGHIYPRGDQNSGVDCR